MISAQLAHHVLWHFGRSRVTDDGYPIGIEPGDFLKSLFHTISLADIHNKLRLAQGFPDEVAAVYLVTEHPAGVLELTQLIVREVTGERRGDAGPQPR